MMVASALFNLANGSGMVRGGGTMVVVFEVVVPINGVERKDIRQRVAFIRKNGRFSFSFEFFAVKAVSA